MIICSKIFLGGHAPLDPLATSMPSLYKPTWQLSRMRASLSYLLSSPQVRECSWFWRVSELPQHSHQRLCWRHWAAPSGRKGRSPHFRLRPTCWQSREGWWFYIQIILAKMRWGDI